MLCLFRLLKRNSSKAYFYKRCLYFAAHSDDIIQTPLSDLWTETNREQEIYNLTNNYTAPALASALRDREIILQQCARLCEDGRIDELKKVLNPYLLKRSKGQNEKIIPSVIDENYLESIRKLLNRMPRQVGVVIPKRGGVFIPLCMNENGNPSILFTQRSCNLVHHRCEICFPGGMKDKEDNNIIETAKRELEEEIGVKEENVDVLGILRCDWSEIRAQVGIGVTPVVGYIGDLRNLKLKINVSEVSSVFSQNLSDLCDVNNWLIRDYSTPVYCHDGYIIWGLTGYLTHRFISCIIKEYGRSTLY